MCLERMLLQLSSKQRALDRSGRKGCGLGTHKNKEKTSAQVTEMYRSSKTKSILSLGWGEQKGGVFLGDRKRVWKDSTTKDKKREKEAMSHLICRLRSCLAWHMLLTEAYWNPSCWQTMQCSHENGHLFNESDLIWCELTNASLAPASHAPLLLGGRIYTRQVTVWLPNLRRSMGKYLHVRTLTVQ